MPPTGFSGEEWGQPQLNHMHWERRTWFRKGSWGCCSLGKIHAGHNLLPLGVNGNVIKVWLIRDWELKMFCDPGPLLLAPLLCTVYFICHALCRQAFSASLHTSLSYRFLSQMSMHGMSSHRRVLSPDSQEVCRVSSSSASALIFPWALPHPCPATESMQWRQESSLPPTPQLQE